MSRWDDLLQQAAARALAVPAPLPSTAPVQAPAPSIPASEDDLATWLATAELPAGPVVIAADALGVPCRTLTDPRKWARASLCDLFPTDRPSGETLMPHVTACPEIRALRRRCLLQNIARVREVLRLGRPLTANEEVALRRLHA